VLRLAYDESGRVTGVDLLSGERVFAKKAIVSNLTIWDTYGKLVGLNRTPSEIKKHLSTLHGTGVYVVYAGFEESAMARLPGERMRVEDGEGDFTLATSSGIAPPGKRAVTFTTRTEIDSWFAYQTQRGRLTKSGPVPASGKFLELECNAALPEHGSEHRSDRKPPTPRTNIRDSDPLANSEWCSRYDGRQSQAGNDKHSPAECFPLVATRFSARATNARRRAPLRP
jgi:hypothetical protein